MAFEEFKYHELTKKIIGCAMKIHRHFGLGFPEIVYKKALLIELRKLGLNCSEEVSRDIYYDGIFIYRRRLDVLVEDLVLVELKARSDLEPRDSNKTLNYLRIFEIEIGLLFNFGASSLQFKRFINSLIH